MGGLFSYLNTSLRLAQKSEENAHSYYAADSGIEDAYIFLMNDKDSTHWTQENITKWVRDSYSMNGYSVNVRVEDRGENVYEIQSTASDETGNVSQVRAYIRYGEVPVFLENAIVSNGDLNIGSDITVVGDGVYVGSLSTGGDVEGELIQLDDIPDWPVANDLANFYWEDVKDLGDYPDDLISCNQDSTIGPLYRNGDLEIKWDDNNVTITLNGTIYVTGNVVLNPTGGAVLDLNGQTLFVEGKIEVSSGLSFAGSGCLYAVGDILMQSDVATDPNGFLHAMSIEGMFSTSSSNTFYGIAAGYTEVKIQSDCSFVLPGSPTDLNNPWGQGESLQVLQYDIVNK